MEIPAQAVLSACQAIVIVDFAAIPVHAAKPQRNATIPICAQRMSAKITHAPTVTILWSAEPQAAMTLCSPYPAFAPTAYAL